MAKTADVSKSFVKKKIPPAFSELLEKPFSYPVPSSKIWKNPGENKGENLLSFNA